MRRISCALFAASLVLFACSGDDSKPTAATQSQTAQSQPTDSSAQATLQRVKEGMLKKFSGDSASPSIITDVELKGSKYVVKTTLGKAPNDGKSATQICVDAIVFGGAPPILVEIVSSDGTLIGASRDPGICGPRV